MDSGEEEKNRLDEPKGSSEELASILDRSQIADYISLPEQPRRLLYLDFLAHLTS